MKKPWSLLLSTVLLAPSVVLADDSHPGFTGVQTGPNEWTYALTFAPLLNYSIFRGPRPTNMTREEMDKSNPTTITLTGLFGVVAASGPTSTDFPALSPADATNRDWSATVLDGGTKVVYTKVGGGTGNYPSFRHAFGFTIRASRAVNGTVSLATHGFSRDTTYSLSDGSFNLDIKGTIDGPVNPADARPPRL
jgi:hypothetical protein